MSASFGLVRFAKTGCIYYGCYEGTVDIMLPDLCTPEECFNKNDQSYEPIDYCRQLHRMRKGFRFPENISDLDDIEIYSNYGRGFYWSGKGSESIKMIKECLMPWDQCYDDIYDGMPDWAAEFLKHKEDSHVS